MKPKAIVLNNGLDTAAVRYGKEYQERAQPPVIRVAQLAIQQTPSEEGPMQCVMLSRDSALALRDFLNEVFAIDGETFKGE